MTRAGLILFLLFASFLKLPAQGLPNSCVKSTEGKEFWFGFMENRLGFGCGSIVPENYLEVTVTSRFDCQFTITLGKSAVVIASDLLQPGIPKKIRIERTLAEPSGSENIEDKALHLVSDQPLNLYAMNFGYNSVDAAVIFPVDALGSEYYAMCYEPHVDLRLSACGPFFNGKNSEFVVVASEDQTQVTITPSKETDKLHPANVPFTITLNKGELCQVQSMNMPGLTNQGDLTGSRIVSDKPVAVYSGSWATTVPATSVYAWDHLYEQIPPVSSWGRKFVAVPLKTRLKDTYRVLASADQTNVTIGSDTSVVLNRGEFYEFMLAASEPSLVESSHPVLLAQYSNSNDVDKPEGLPLVLWSGDGDPSMLIVSPVDKTRENVTFVAYDTPEITEKIFVNIVARDDAAPMIRLNGGTITFLQLPGTGYSYAQVPVLPDSHNLSSLEAGKGFIAYVYGFGGVESYGYGVGFNLNVTLDLGGTVNASGEKTLVNCNPAEPVTLSAGENFKTYAWSTGAVTSSIQVSNPGTYSVKVTTNEGCVLEDSVRVIVSVPVIDLGADTAVCAPDVLVLDAGSSGQLETYTWTTPSGTLAGQKITVSAPGTYAVEGVNSYGCKATDEILVEYLPKPDIDLGEDRTVCSTETVVLDAGTLDSFSSYVWNTPDGTFTSQTVVVTKPGIYSVEAMTQKGCTAQDTVTIGLSAKPVLDLSRIETLICGTFSTALDISADRPVEFLVTSTPEVVVNGLNLTVAPENAGTYPVTITARDASSCETTETVRIGFYPTPSAGFSLDPDLCLEPGENQISYLGTGTAQDTYQWDISDFNAGEIVSDPGITRGPFVFQLNDKPQATIGLQVVSQSGCNSEKASVTVKRKPVFTYGAGQAEGCVPLEVQFSASAGDPVDQVDYFWNFGDGNEVQGEQVTQNFTVPGTYSLTLWAVSSLTGCQAEITDPEAVTVHPNPVAGFSLKPEMVYNDQPEVAFLDQSSGAVSYNWDFGDGTSSVIQNPVHRFQSAGYKKVIQTVFNEFNCTDSLSRVVTVAISRIFTPNAFSPNASGEVDREFRLFMNGIVEEGYRLRILSRWNDVLFDCRDEIKGWDGKLSNGSMAPPGNYVWILEFRDFMGKSHRQTGTVTLLY